MAEGREVLVHLTPQLASAGRMNGGVAVVIDVLRATTTMIHALAAGCTMVRPCVEVDEARAVAGAMRAGRVLLGGERDGQPLPGFDLGNSPSEYTGGRCRGAVLVLTTSNGTRALLHAAGADRTLVAAFVNLLKPGRPRLPTASAVAPAGRAAIPRPPARRGRRIRSRRLCTRPARSPGSRPQCGRSAWQS